MGAGWRGSGDVEGWACGSMGGRHMGGMRCVLLYCWSVVSTVEHVDVVAVGEESEWLR